MILKAIDPLFWCIKSKTIISPRRKHNFLCCWHFAQDSSWHLLFFSHSNCSSSSRNRWGSGVSKVQRQHHMNTYCVTDGCIVECPRSLCFKTMWAGKYLIPIRGQVQRTYTSVAWRIIEKYQRTYTSVAWRIIEKYQRTYTSVAWRILEKYQRTYTSVAWRIMEKYQRTYTSEAWRISDKHQRTYTSIAWRITKSTRELSRA